MPAPTKFSDTAEWSQHFQPFADAIYQEVFSDSTVTRFYNPPAKQSSTERFLDQLCHVDGFITRPNGMKHFFQEKFHNTTFGTVTIEYDGGKGEWARNMAQLHCEGYGDPTAGFHTFYIINLFELYDAIAAGWLVGTKRQNVTHSSADFYAFDIDEVVRVIPHALRYRH